MSRRKASAGNSIIEFSLLLPWFLFLFTGVFDFGFCAYALIAVQDAARVAVLHSAANAATAGDQGGASSLAVQELTGLPTVGPSYNGACNADPAQFNVVLAAGGVCAKLRASGKLSEQRRGVAPGAQQRHRITGQNLRHLAEGTVAIFLVLLGCAFLLLVAVAILAGVLHDATAHGAKQDGRHEMN